MRSLTDCGALTLPRVWRPAVFCSDGYLSDLRAPSYETLTPQLITGKGSTVSVAVAKAPPPYSRGTWLRSTFDMAPEDLAGKVFTSVSYKGGIGKTMLAYEIAFLLGAILVDLDWDKGGATVKWGYNEDLRVNSPMISALRNGRTPRPLTGGLWKPDLVPASITLKDEVPPTRVFADTLLRWATDLGKRRRQPVVFDTHPGGGGEAFAPASIAHVVMGVVELGEQEMQAGAQMIEEFKGYPLLVVPNRVTGREPERYISWLEKVAAEEQVPVAPPIVNMRDELKWRRGRAAVTANRPTKKWAAFRKDVEGVAGAAVTYARAA